MTESARAKPREWWMDKVSVLDKGKCILFEAHLNKPKDWDIDRGEESIHAIEKSAYDSIMADARKLCEALKFECGDRCAQQNPCNAKEVIEEFKRKHGG